ncbi:hypothetical protein N8I82_01890 [Granulicatella adiacens]|uniref:hypothetical protein n=1 Tax=Granulicatella adiacens TaxID=46124 RepID=UPI0021D92E95|nr:hypothetical protein [Granulicatella adiacens]UXY41786.1 hypothetical protein N8I82_01890 [Granulicatella adiacens]
MNNKNKLFGASFEQSKRIVPRRFAIEDGAQMGVSVSMSFWKRVFGLVGLMFSLIAYGVGVYMTDGLRNSTDSVQVISESTGALIGEIGAYFRPINLVLVILFTALIILNIFPKFNYAYQLIYGNFLLIMFGLLAIFSALPLLIGLTIGAFGTLAFIVQLIFFGYLVKILIVDVMKGVKTSLYNEKEIKDKDWGIPINKFVKRYGGILLGLSILNRWTFNFGEFSKSNPGLMSFLSGFLFIPLISLLLFAEGQILKNFIKAFYFFKYRKEYREYFNISDEQWYGKFRARFMSKQK